MVTAATADTSQILNGSPEVTNPDVEARASDGKEEEVEIPRMSLWMTLGLLGAVTVVSNLNSLAITALAHKSGIACGRHSRIFGSIN
jgi:hypothetical protein